MKLEPWQSVVSAYSSTGYVLKGRTARNINPGALATKLSISPRMHFSLPDLQGICPFQPITNPHYDAVVEAARTWGNSFGILSPKKQRHFAASFLELLAAHTYPYADLEGFRTCCYFTNIVFLLDDFSDDERGGGARTMTNSFMNAIRDPTLDDGTPFARLAIECVDPSSPPVSFPDIDNSGLVNG